MATDNNHDDTVIDAESVVRLTKKGNWLVTRWCCTSGQCVDCHGRGNDGAKSVRQRIVHSYGLSQKSAEFIAGNWRSYDAKAAEIDPKEGAR